MIVSTIESSRAVADAKGSPIRRRALERVAPQSTLRRLRDARTTSTRFFLREFPRFGRNRAATAVGSSRDSPASMSSVQRQPRMTQFQIRRAGAADADAIARLLDQLGYPTENADVPRRLDQLMNHHRGAVLLADHGEQVVGLATVHILSVLNRRRDVAWLTALVVDESMRGSGVGRSLVNAVEDFARQAGCERLSVTTHEDRAGAQAFYVRVGLEQTGRRFGKMLSS
jgi:N-acetylglutamate synthase-like GNAT family acetyltransferase